MIKRVLLAIPPTGRYIREDRCQTPVDNIKMLPLRPPIDLMYAAAALERKGIICQIQDYPAYWSTWEDFKKDLLEFQPEMVLFSFTTPTLTEDIQACRIVKEVNPGIITVAKGAHFNTRDREAMAQFPELDICLRGEYDFTPAEIATTPHDLDSIPGITFRKGTEIIRNPDRKRMDNLDELPFPARHLVNNELYFRPDTGETQSMIITGRGCPFHCVYCLSRQVDGNIQRNRSPENIVAEIRECVEKYQIRNFLFSTETITFNKPWLLELCRQIVQSGLKIQWVCTSRVDTLDEERLIAMKEAGCWMVGLGVESGDQEILNHYRKGITLDQSRTAVKLLRKTGFTVLTFQIIGSPWETYETYRKTVNFTIELNPDFADFGYFYPFPGTEGAEEVIQLGLTSGEQLTSLAYEAPAFPTFYLTMDQLRPLRKKALMRFLLRPSYIFNKIKTAKSPKVIVNYIRCGLAQLIDVL